MSEKTANSFEVQNRKAQPIRDPEFKPTSRSPTTAYYVITARYRFGKTANSFEGKIVSSTSQLFAYMIGTANLNLKLIIFLGLSLICMLCYDYNLNTLKLTVIYFPYRLLNQRATPRYWCLKRLWIDLRYEIISSTNEWSRIQLMWIVLWTDQIGDCRTWTNPDDIQLWKDSE